MQFFMCDVHILYWYRVPGIQQQLQQAILRLHDETKTSTKYNIIHGTLKYLYIHVQQNRVNFAYKQKPITSGMSDAKHYNILRSILRVLMCDIQHTQRSVHVDSSS